MVNQDDLVRCQDIIDYRFADPALLAEALTHASIADSRLESNERLEFLGDSVLGMLVCEYLYVHFDDLLEGDMTKIKSAVVSRRLCAKIIDELGLQEFLALGKGMRTRSALPSSLSAALLESIIGAIYMDAGLERVREWLMPRLAPHINAAARSGHQQNFKSVLQQFAQQELSVQPEYVLLDEKGPDHAKCFEVRVELGSEAYPSCWAPSKKQAEQQAALTALRKLGVVQQNGNGEMVVPQDEADLASAEH
jgi:ribonuclease III